MTHSYADIITLPLLYIFQVFIENEPLFPFNCFAPFLFQDESGESFHFVK